MRDTILSYFLSEIHVRHTIFFADKLYWEHPYRHTLFGLYDMLKSYNIESVGVNIADKCMDELEMPFIAHTGKNFAVVQKIESSEVLYWEDGKNIKIPLNSFRDMWTGFALFVEKNAETREPDWNKHLIACWLKRFTDYFPLLLLILIVLLKFVLNFYLMGIVGYALLVVNLLGVIIGILLFNKQLYGLDRYTEKICSLFKYGDCNSILNSSAAKLWGIFSWSEIGLSYFLSTLILFVFFPFWGGSLALCNVVTLPYTIWSVWYQYRVIKQWCPLCLSVVTLLWLTFGINFISGIFSLYAFNVGRILFIGIIYLFVFFSLHWVATKVIRLKQLEYDKYELNRFKRMENVFLSQLKQSTFYEVDENSSSILWGNQDARLRITIFTNPYCEPCAQMHERVCRLLKKTGETVCIQYIFSSFSEELEMGARLLIAVYQEKAKETAMDIYDEWFAGKKYLGKEYLDALKINIETNDVSKELELHKTWRQKNSLAVTPVIIVNGYLLPESYRIEDLEYFANLDYKTS